MMLFFYFPFIPIPSNLSFIDSLLADFLLVISSLKVAIHSFHSLSSHWVHNEDENTMQNESLSL